jgi:PAS domain S-box-containing protein
MASSLMRSRGAAAMVPSQDPVNILLGDDQPAQLLSYEVFLGELGHNLIKAASAREALEHLLKTEMAVVLVDVCMPELDGFELASMIREHPRHQRTAIIFVSAIQVTEFDSLRGYEAGAVDYVPVPVVPEVLRAKVRIFAELYRKTGQLEHLNAELEKRVAERTLALEASAAQLRESEQRRNLALAAGRMGSWEWDLASGVCNWDEGQYRICGVDPATFSPDPCSIASLIHPADLVQLRETFGSGVKGGQTYDAEFRILRPTGEIRWCIVSGAATLDPSGRPCRLSGVTLDITERKLAEEGLRQLNEELEHRIEERTREREIALAQLFEAQKIDTIGQLTGGVAHDFNNLLMAVLGSLELLKKRLAKDDARSHRFLDNAVHGAKRGAALTQRLLAFARRQELKPESVDVAKLVASIEDLLERAVGPGILISKRIPKSLSPVLVDYNQLELALLNLSVNARDAMPQGGRLLIAAGEQDVAPGQSASAGLAPGKYVRIDVSDTGVGMDAATLARATEPFFTTNGPGKGTGLGLSMVHGLAAQSGGAMTVSSEIGKGTTIQLWLPQAERSSTLPGKDHAPPSDDVIPGAASPELTILVVDDDMLVCAGTSAMLEDLGHKVIEASSGAEALDTLKDNNPGIELMITDYAMPGMTGLDLARRVRQIYPGLAIILASGYAEIEEGADHIAPPRLAKPFALTDLAAAIAAALDRSPRRETQIMRNCL